MNIVFSKRLKEKFKKDNITKLTVTTKKKRGSSAVLIMGHAYFGTPKKKAENFETHIVDNIEVYVDKNVKLTGDTINLDYEELFLLKRIDVHGIEIKRALF